MSDATKSVDDELRAKIDMEFARFNMLGHTQLIENITQLFATKLQEAEIRARVDESTPNASDDGKAVRVFVPQRNHIGGTDYDRGWNDCWDAFWAARWKRVGDLTQDTKGGTEQ